MPTVLTREVDGDGVLVRGREAALGEGDGVSPGLITRPFVKAAIATITAVKKRSTTARGRTTLSTMTGLVAGGRGNSAVKNGQGCGQHAIAAKRDGTAN